jgi:hypothetical protein
MNGNLMYEMTRQRINEKQQSARKSGEARSRIAAALGRRGRRAEPEAAVPAIPDFAHELLKAGARDGVPSQRQETARGRHARTGR